MTITAVEYKIKIPTLHALRGQLITRRREDVTWQDIAEEAGVSPNTISGIINNRSSGSLDTVQRLVDMFNANGIAATYEDLLDRVS